jgi:hypothetical protein
VALALVGGRLGGKYIIGLKVVVEGKRLPEPEPEPEREPGPVAGGVFPCEVPGGH